MGKSSLLVFIILAIEANIFADSDTGCFYVGITEPERTYICSLPFQVRQGVIYFVNFPELDHLYLKDSLSVLWYCV